MTTDNTSKDDAIGHKIDLLRMAKSYHDNETATGMQAIELQYTFGGHPQPEQVNRAQKQYSIDDLIATAEKLYAFVQVDEKDSGKQFLTESDRRMM